MENIESKEAMELKEQQELEKSVVDGILLQNSKALSSLAQYTDSDASEYSDSDADESQPKQQYREAKSSSSSSSSDSSDEEIAVSLSDIKKKIEEKSFDYHDDGDSDGEEGNAAKKKKEPLKVKGELGLEDLPPIQDLQIKVDEKDCLELGTISSIVDQLVLVQAYAHSAPLDIDSILFIDRGQKALGQIFDVIGPVSGPIYCIRFNSNEDIKSRGISIGDKVFCAPRTEYTSYVILSSIMGRGSDASWKNDVEPPEGMMDYSDDESERKSKKASRNKNEQGNASRQPRRNFNSHQQNQYPMSWHQQSQNMKEKFVVVDEN